MEVVTYSLVRTVRCSAVIMTYSLEEHLTSVRCVHHGCKGIYAVFESIHLYVVYPEKARKMLANALTLKEISIPAKFELFDRGYM